MITKEQFTSFKKVQKDGLAKMYCVKKVAQFSGLREKEIFEIIVNYDKLTEKYGKTKRAYLS